ncbi:hypothetical protein SAMN05518672_102555 [Chitinophaga sp. CF118]|uniref:hypothetical protein n=1 Tax=Chitinophaga sp. CF118 TaxID=1884367 RepID=UPI0008E55149|nr:hypothetical protein [Chitinophaga sp. CF118]SFD59892.1 hypothetical protein SAMN05518672_102555 [Chitinophaga sp. CF118]
MKKDEVPQVNGSIEATVSVPAAQRLMVGLNSTSLELCSVSIPYFDGDTVTVSYKGLPGNQPATYKNFVAIWQDSMIPWTAMPLAQLPIGQNSQQGTLVISGLTITSSAYIVGYGVGPDITNICCSSIISAGGLLAAPTQVSISLNYLGTSSLSIHYQTLGGYLPQQYNNWIGLWKGYASPYSAVAPVSTVMINSNASEGTVGMNNVPLGINSNYTLIYFMGKENTMAAAILNFNTSTPVTGT